MSHGGAKRGGRVAARIAEELKARITAGDVGVGQYLPGVREVGREHKVSPETARRAMKIMEAEHWVSVHPGHGFRVTALGNDPAKAAPVAFILAGRLPGGRWTSLCQLMVAAVQRATEERGWSTLSLGTRGRGVGSMVEQLKAARVAGLLLDTPHAPLIRALGKLGVPTVLVEEHSPGLDCVAQDNFGGALRAAEHLVERGHRRIGWFGAISPAVQSRERWGGAAAALRDSGALMAPEHAVDAEAPGAGERLREVLAGPDRPTGLLALWWGAAVEAARVARDLGLEPGRDVEIVSWCPREQLAEFKADCPGGEVPATMTWSMRQLGEAAVARLAERRRRPEMPRVRICVETELLVPEAAGS